MATHGRVQDRTTPFFDILQSLIVNQYEEWSYLLLNRFLVRALSTLSNQTSEQTCIQSLDNVHCLKIAYLLGLEVCRYACLASLKAGVRSITGGL